MSDYFTHQQYLSKELSALNNNSIVLELGIGEGSSPLMYDFCKNNPDSTVYAFDSDQIWLDRIKPKYSLNNYIIEYIDDWSNINKYVNFKKIDLAFIDQAPWEARITTINLLKNNTNIFIVHDYDYYNIGYPSLRANNEQSWWGQNYSKEFVLEDNYEILPPTLVMRKK
jgi:hypothetical protein